MGRNSSSSKKAVRVHSRYASKYVNEIMTKFIEKKLNTCSYKHKSTVEKWLDKMRKNVLGKISSVSCKMFSDKRDLLSLEVKQLTELIASKSKELKTLGIDSIKQAYTQDEPAAYVRFKQVIKSPVKTEESNIHVERLKTLQSVSIPSICAKLTLISSQVGTIDKAFAQRAQTINETLIVVQEELSKLS